MLGVQLFEKEANAFHIDQKQLNAQEITNPLRDGKSRIMKLLGSSDINHRIEFLTNLYNKAGEIMLHLDKLRQRNMNYALLIFGGLFGLGIKIDGLTSKVTLSSLITIIMIIFTLWDRQIHRYRHGWESTRSTFYRKIGEIINDHAIDLEIEQYRVSGEKKAEWISIQPIIFYFLILGGILSLAIFYVSSTN